MICAIRNWIFAASFECVVESHQVIYVCMSSLNAVVIWAELLGHMIFHTNCNLHTRAVAA